MRVFCSEKINVTGYLMLHITSRQQGLTLLSSATYYLLKILYTVVCVFVYFFYFLHILQNVVVFSSSATPEGLLFRNLIFLKMKISGYKITESSFNQQATSKLPYTVLHFLFLNENTHETMTKYNYIQY